MLRPDATIERFHIRQVGTLPDHYGLQVTAVAEGRLAAQLELRAVDDGAERLPACGQRDPAGRHLRRLRDDRAPA